jgi:hypothetical protein
VSYPPSGSDPNRPQDRPEDTPPTFPTYGRPQQPTQPPYQQQPPYQGQAPYQGPHQQQGPPAYPPAYEPPPTPYGYGYGYPGSSQNKTNGLATAALVTGLAGILFAITAPVAIGLGIAALVQIKRRHEGGTGQAVAGLVVGSVVTVGWAALIAVVVIIGINGNDYQNDDPVPTYNSSATHVDDLAVGECFDDGAGEDEVVRRPCAEPHDAELVSNVTLPAGPYPGDRKAEDAAQAQCDLEFGKYIGNTVDKSELNSGYWYPGKDSWSHGDRLVVCAVYGPDDEQLTGTVKGSKR